MPLLKDILRKNTEKSGPAPSGLFVKPKSKNKNGDNSSQAGSAHSVRSVAGSIASFFTARGIGGERIPKRRRPDASRLGAPTFYHRVQDVPREAPVQLGTEEISVNEIGEYSIAHGKSWMPPDGAPAWFSVVLYNHGKAGDPNPVYHPGTRITGQARVHLAKPTNLDFVSLSLTGQTFTKFGAMFDHPANQGPFLTAQVNLWAREDGDPTQLADGAKGRAKFKGKVPAGTYVFPFEFEPWPHDMIVGQPGSNIPKVKYARLALPPSFTFAANPAWIDKTAYMFTLNIMETAKMTLPTRLAFPLTYVPRTRALPPTSTLPFPFLPSREDWPFTREEVGGWTLTPFGGRGRFGPDMEMVELEGILGVPSPAVFSASSSQSGVGSAKVTFVVLLWSKHAGALEALASEGSCKVQWAQAVTSTLDALSPHSTAARKNRITRVEGVEGRVWRSGDEKKEEAQATNGLPASDNSETAAEVVKQTALARSETPPKAATTSLSPTLSSSKLRTSHSPLSPLSQAAMGISLDLVEEEEEIDPNKRAPSPVPSFEEDATLAEEVAKDQGTTIRLEGSIDVPASSISPSFRWKYFSLEYLVHLTFSHPEYSHISPRALGVVAESPVWIVSDPSRPREAVPAPSVIVSTAAQDLDAVPKTGGAVPLGLSPVTLPKRLARMVLAQPEAKFEESQADFI